MLTLFADTLGAFVPGGDILALLQKIDGDLTTIKDSQITLSTKVDILAAALENQKICASNLRKYLDGLDYIAPLKSVCYFNLFTDTHYLSLTSPS